MAKQKRRRSSYVKLPTVELANSPVSVWGYDIDGELVCTLRISSAGIAVTPRKGRKELYDVTWERLLRILKEAKGE